MPVRSHEQDKCGAGDYPRPTNDLMSRDFAE